LWDSPKDINEVEPNQTTTDELKCRICQKTFSRVDNRNCHEVNVHGQASSSQTSGTVLPASNPTQRVQQTRSRTNHRPALNIINFDNPSPRTRKLLEEGKRAVEERLKKRQEDEKKKSEDRKQAMELRKKVLAEKNCLAEENERKRKEKEAEIARRRKEAYDNLIKNRKRKR
jgi:hypothetical protein